MYTLCGGSSSTILGASRPLPPCHRRTRSVVLAIADTPSWSEPVVAAQGVTDAVVDRLDNAPVLLALDLGLADPLERLGVELRLVDCREDLARLRLGHAVRQWPRLQPRALLAGRDLGMPLREPLLRGPPGLRVVALDREEGAVSARVFAGGGEEGGELHAVLPALEVEDQVAFVGDAPDFDVLDVLRLEAADQGLEDRDDVRLRAHEGALVDVRRGR